MVKLIFLSPLLVFLDFACIYFDGVPFQVCVKKINEVNPSEVIRQHEKYSVLSGSGIPCFPLFRRFAGTTAAFNVVITSGVVLVKSASAKSGPVHLFFTNPDFTSIWIVQQPFVAQPFIEWSVSDSNRLP